MLLRHPFVVASASLVLLLLGAGADPERHVHVVRTASVRLGSHDVDVALGAEGAALRLDHGAPTEFGLARIGRTHLSPVARGVVRERAGGVERSLGTLTEWWQRAPSGLEHGVTLHARPVGEGALILELAVRGALHPTSLPDGSIGLDDAEGVLMGRYEHLLVIDADGARIPARMAAVSGSIRIVVDDAEARYPVIVDPLLVTEEAVLVAPDRAADDQFGWSVAITADGTRAVVGVPYDDTPVSNAGTARVFVRSGSGWSQEGVLALAAPATDSFHGYSVAIADDGSRALVGAWSGTSALGRTGSATMYVRSGSTWTVESQLHSDDLAPFDEFGNAVALSSDGLLALVAAPQDDGEGTIRVYERGSTVWSQQGVLRPAAGTGQYFGDSVAVSGDGTRAIVGSSFAGTAWIFHRAGSTWDERAMLTVPGGGSGGFGAALALSGDGQRALVGAPRTDGDGGFGVGAAYVYAWTGSSWAEEAVMVPSTGSADDRFGRSVAFDASGLVALVGAPGYDPPGGPSDPGVAWIWNRTGSVWSEGAPIRPLVEVAGGSFGYRAALSDDGATALVGALLAPSGPSQAGRVVVFKLDPTRAQGATCELHGICTSGFCVDGVCCDVRCGGDSTADCQSCSAALGASADGTCTLRPASDVCRASAGACDPAEVCSGSSPSCPVDALRASGTVCNLGTGGCQLDAVCTGTGPACPSNALVPPGVVCRGAIGDCDVAEACDGASPSCPLDALRPPDVVCRPRDPLAFCDVDDVCTGASAVCPASYLDAGTICDATNAGPCDTPDVCAGTTAACVPTFLAGVACRAATDACDLAEVCGGASASCPPDGLVSSGLTCRASVDGMCDPVEVCDGASSLCPADQNTCAPTTDAGGASPDGGLPDGSVSDGGPPSAATGCSASSAGSTRHHGAVLGLLAVLVLVRRRRARRPHVR